MCWVLPSYLREVLLHPDETWSATEYLIYNLGPAPEFEEETRLRFSLLSAKQHACLLAIITFWQESEQWSEYCGSDLLRAKSFLEQQVA